MNFEEVVIMTLNEYTQEVYDYLDKKLPNCNPATLCEIAEFFVMKSSNFANDLLVEHNTAMQKMIDRRDKQWIKVLEKIGK